jgi:hypothetical protein
MPQTEKLSRTATIDLPSIASIRSKSAWRLPQRCCNKSLFQTPSLFRRKAAHIALATGLAVLAMSNPLLAANLGQNLIVNGDAEQGSGDPVGNAIGSAIPAIPGWTPTGSFSVLQYGSAGFSFTNGMGQVVNVSGLPDATTSAPTNRGKNFFYGGGDRASSSATQTIDLANLSQTIDTGSLKSTLSGWLGGYENDPDSASLVVSFLSASGTVLGSSSIIAPTPAQRNNTTGLFFRSIDRLVPVGTRQAQVLLSMNYIKGRVNDGYADNLSLTITAVPEPSPILGSLFVGAGLIVVRRRRSRQIKRS